MRKTRIILLAVVGAALAGCVSPKVTTSAPAAVNFHQFHTVKLVVTDSAKTAYAKEGLPMFEGLLKGRLESLGYTLVEAEPGMMVNVTISQFDPGNRTMRTLIGFGAGRAVLKFTAQFKDPNGKLLAELEGGKTYHGLEMADNPTFKSDESTRMGLISYSVSQIGEFIQNNGREHK
ncbi:MAG: DUF4410 domain-containing protein [Verrucomicrobia subdivision 3 bacterium]|nr:DUF4410 domain-containing protein [Limisphaerales bacterium]